MRFGVHIPPPPPPRRNTRWRVILLVALLASVVALVLVFFRFQFSPSDTSLDNASDKGSSGAGGTQAAIVDPFFADVKCEKRDTVIPRMQLREHASEKSLWLAIGGLVLDMTEFIPQHPGGPAIMQGANVDGFVDSSDMFRSNHQSFVLGMFNKFCIGRLGS
eukprot:TRINITY_DN5336_c0_g1_i1.p1 TRINITY_DN5336_c0_g1~~TRINITY_DN5336_c0_g1_i1.p1  ORF type:complete len:162 (-),score=9.52 TRINITY_DN5336_c0_g1_i1:205-690(-)